MLRIGGEDSETPFAVKVWNRFGIRQGVSNSHESGVGRYMRVAIEVAAPCTVACESATDILSTLTRSNMHGICSSQQVGPY